ncbi:hypothetical protein EDD18DRAFT_1456803 [Armillaria luteobubalina]|uniref:Heterokaryon incompatibility domain-containing protein n=1 Tax=Armillaria luteobubalina TaxID=153913 RepID=A0AA39QPX2_9AGAR|nr:hypothetical protein EDD18DRAFT_1456803 [Armillaria luteobubalina]
MARLICGPGLKSKSYKQLCGMTNVPVRETSCDHMVKADHIYHSVPQRKLRHARRYQRYRDHMVPQAKRNSRPKRFEELVEEWRHRKSSSKGFVELMEKWRCRHFDYIFPSIKKELQIECSENILRYMENRIEETEVGSQQQITYKDLLRSEPWLKVYKYTNPSEAEERLERSALQDDVHQITPIILPSCADTPFRPYVHLKKPIILPSLADTPFRDDVHLKKPIILPSLADIPCVDLGVDGLCIRLNEVLHTKYPLTSSLSRLLKSYIAKCYDFGTAYAHLRPLWHDNRIKMKLRKRKVLDQKMREEALVDNIIVSRLVPPRRVWDLYSNRVVPWWVVCQNPWAVSHAWMDEKDRKFVLTPVNGYQWPVPIPKDTDIDHIRNEMLELGAEYVWLDVLCLRQTGGDEENKRSAEWAVDVPSIGRVYEMAESVVYYFCGLGRPFTAEQHDLESDRSWFRRAWTLQEINRHPIIGGTTVNNAMMYEMMPAKFREQLLSLEKNRAARIRPN